MLVVFIRPAKESDLEQIIDIYQRAFAGPPWNEVWSAEEIIKDLEFARSQPNPIVLVAEIDNKLVGVTWGYQLPLEKFPFLDGKVDERASYMDETAVLPEKWGKGIGPLLGREYLRVAEQQGMSEIVLRTDVRNRSSMRLFRKLGLRGIPDQESLRKKVYDPEFFYRIYLRKELG